MAVSFFFYVIAVLLVGQCAVKSWTAKSAMYATTDWYVTIPEAGKATCHVQYGVCGWTDAPCPLNANPEGTQVELGVVDRPMQLTYVPACGGCWGDPGELTFMIVIWCVGLLIVGSVLMKNYEAYCNS